MKTISPEQLNPLLRSRPDLVLIDVSTPVEYAAVHVSNSLNVPLDELKPEALARVGNWPKNQPIYLLCSVGVRAGIASKKLAGLGYEETVVVEGGTRACIQTGLPVVRGKVKAISLERQVRIVAGSIVLTGIVLGWLVHPGFYGLSAFVGAGLVFAGVTDFCGMALLLARLPWNKRVRA